MNTILLEFLNINQTQAQLIVKRCENFVRGVRNNNMDEDEEEREEEVDIKESKRNKSSIKEKLARSSTGYNYILVLMIIVYISLEVYFDILYIQIDKHKGKIFQFFQIYNETQFNNINQKMIISGIKYFI